MGRCHSRRTSRVNSCSFTIFIYINYLSNGLKSNVKLFADDTSLFSVVHNITDSTNLLNSDLSKINKWALQWKMRFNPDPTIVLCSRDHIQLQNLTAKSPGPYA